MKKTSREFSASEMIDHLIQRAQQEYFSAIRPIFRANDSGSPESIGTCLLIRDKDNYFLVSAAHVIDYGKTSILYVAGNHSLEPLESNFSVTKPPSGNRKVDKFDFAFSRLALEMAEKLGKESFINLVESCDREMNAAGKLHVALGYPTSRNKPKPIGLCGQNLKGKAWAYGDMIESSDQIYEQLGISKDTHLCLKFDKYGLDRDGAKTKTVDPHGASGGLLINAGCGSTSPVIAGILIEVRKTEKVIVATRIECLASAIRQAG